MKISVLISTYNGERFVEEQLESLLGQTVQPDEVLIIDDCSTDSTYAKTQAFLERNNLEGWSLRRNERNRGFRANFHSLAETASGDLIFFCDQDDVWGSRKLEACVDFMAEHPDVNLVCTDFIAGSNRPDEGSLVPAAGHREGNFERVHPHKGKPYIWLGCAMAVRGTFIREILPYWDEDWAHDECVWCMAEASDSCAVLHEAHFWHRVHGGNATGRAVHGKADRAALAREKAEGYAATARFCRDRGIGGDALRLFSGKSACERARAEFLQGPSPLRAALLARHLGYYLEKRSYPVDVAIALGLVK